MAYRYDQLNRLRKARGVLGNGMSNTWDNLTDGTIDWYRSDYLYDANGNITNAERYDKLGNKYDSLSYYYHVTDMDPGTPVERRPLRNRLYQVKELADTPDALANDIGDLPRLPNGINDEFDASNSINDANNYGYDALGNLIRDNNEQIAGITWTVAGKVKDVDQATGSGKKDLTFGYGADGQRIVKSVFDDDGGEPLHRDYYIRDAQGNVMAMYRATDGSFKQTEKPLYGSSRLGVDQQEQELCALDLNTYQFTPDLPGQLRYELTDHLGNVTSVLTDELVPVDVDDDDVTDYFQPHVVSAQGYEPFGSLLPGRNYSSSSYRFGFQNQEKDDEVYGSTGTAISFEYRIHDPRVGRFLSIDPLAAKYPHNSPYAFSENRVIDGIEFEGLEVVLPSTSERFAFAVLSKSEDFRKQSPEEQRAACKLGVWTSIQIKRSADMAADFTKKVGLDRHSITGNGLRHAYGQAMATFHTGADAAKAMGDAHEGPAKNVMVDHPEWTTALEKDGRVLIPNQLADNFVDQWNNQVGREIGESPAIWNVEGQGMDVEALEDAVLDAYNTGKLIERTMQKEGGSTWITKTAKVRETSGDPDDSTR